MKNKQRRITKSIFHKRLPFFAACITLSIIFFYYLYPIIVNADNSYFNSTTATLPTIAVGNVKSYNDTVPQ